jgi:geranylgeranylglycerol-phosphate geranylgeranyltransferase
VGLAGNVINDVYDIEVDRANAPGRPLPSGAVSMRAARLLWVGLSVTGVMLAFATSTTHGVIAAASFVVLWAYSARLKRVPLVGHAVVGGVVALGVAFGALAVEPGPRAQDAVIAGIALTFVLVTAREIVKAIPDIEGDRANGVGSLPVVIGRRPSALVVVAVVACAIAALPAFPAWGYSDLFLAYAVPLASLLLCAGWILLSASAAVRAAPAAWSASATRASGWMKVALAVGTVALALGRAGQ